MSKPRVCFVFPSIYEYLQGNIAGGAHRQLTLLGKQLQDEFEIHFIAGDYGQPQTEHVAGFTLHRSYAPSPTTPKYRELTQLCSLLWAMKRSKADIFIHRGGVKPAIVSYYLSIILYKPWIYNVANDTDLTTPASKRKSVKRLLFVHAIQNAASVITQTEKQAQIISEEYNRNSTIVPNGYPPVDDQLDHRGREFFLWVGRLRSEQKRPHLYLQLAKEFPESEFVMAGDAERENDYTNHIRKEASNLENVTYLGFVEPDKIHRYYRRAKAVINTSEYEGFPSTFLEAWRCETPVISLSIDTGRFANLADSPGFALNDFQKLVNIIEEIADDPELREGIVKPYSDYFVDNYTIDETSNRYAEVIRETI